MRNKKQELNNYYRHTSREAAIKRIRRIASQNVQKVQQVGNQAESSQSVRMSKTIKETRTRYSKRCLPEERARSKLSHAAHLEESANSSSSDDNTKIVVATQTKQKDESTTQPGEPVEGSCKKRKKGSQREKLASKANQEHTEMCSKAMKMIDKKDKILDKFTASDEQTD